jgi:hypothetical protein
MPAAPENLHEEAAILTRAIENLFRKLIRFLIGRVSLVRLQELIRYVFVEEIENKLRSESPTKNISLTQLALLSGLDTRTLTKIRNSKNYRRPFHREVTFLREFAPGASILDVWSSKPPYMDESSGAPRTLSILGKSPSFEELFEECGKSRGITYQSLLHRLIDSGAVSMDAEHNEVSLVLKSYLPSDSRDKMGAIELGFAAVGNMVDTVTRNISALDRCEERLYQRGAWTFRLNEQNKSSLRMELRNLLETTDLRARKIIEKYEDPYVNQDQITAGVSMFYFEETAH